MDKVFKTRIITALFFGITLITLVYLSDISRLILTAIFTCVSVFEYAKMKYQNGPFSYVMFVLALVLILLSYHFKLPHSYKYSLLVLASIYYIILTIFNFTQNTILEKLPLTLFFYPTLSGVILAQEIGHTTLATFPILMGLIALIWNADSFAYIVGRKFGKTKLFERISPNKTIEGFVGGLIFTLFAAIIWYYISEPFSVSLCLIIGALIAVFSVVGDLVQSSIKRFYKVKDSGTILPGHGGIFDRFDSLIYVIPFVYLLINFIKNP